MESRIPDCLGFPHMGGVQGEGADGGGGEICTNSAVLQIARDEIYLWQALASFVITAILTSILDFESENSIFELKSLETKHILRDSTILVKTFGTQVRKM